MRSKSAKMEPRWAQDRSKIAPRSSWIDFFSSSVFVSFFDRFRLRFGAVLGAKMVPKIDTEMPGGGPWGVQGGPGLVLVRSCVRLVARVRFFDPLALLFGPFWDALGPVLGLLGASLRLRGAFLGFSWGGLGGPGRPWARLGAVLCPIGGSGSLF